VHEALETWFHVDHSFLHGFHTLLFRPGVMTRDVNAGRRARHVPTFRFYLVASLLFFFVFMPHPEAVSHANAAAAPGATSAQAPAIGMRVVPDDVELDLPVSPDTQRAIREKLAYIANHPDRLVGDYVHRLPKALLVLLPLFALLTRLAFGGSKYLYLQHLILSVHLHTSLMFACVALSGWSALLGLLWGGFAYVVAGVGFIYLVWYFFATLHRVFEVSRRKALLMGSGLGVAYGLLVSLMLISTLVLTLLW
jgi:hypothetical protein